jgi:curved DNA-binding protein
MLHASAELTVEEACARLGLPPDAPPSALQGAFQRALKSSHGPDGHVPADRYRQIIDAYRVLRTREPPGPEPRRYEDWPSQIELTAAEAVAGGPKVGRLPTGRPFETRLPAGLRDGDLVWVWGWLLQVRIDEGGDLAVRGNDVWITARKPASQLKAGQRITIETPTGPFSFRLSAEAVAAGLARAPGLGLPAKRGHACGDLYVRLVEERRAQPRPVEILKRLAPHRAA